MEYDIEDMRDELEAGEAQLLDVRETDEWEAGHLSQATLVPLSGLREGSCPAGPNKAMKTYLHCRSGRRVLEAAPLLEQLGFSQVVPLQEGFEDLMAEGFELGQ